MDRIEKLQKCIDEILFNNKDIVKIRNGYVHLYGVAQACVMLAKKRSLNQELAAMAGMLHDIYNYQYSYCKDHAQKSAVLSREILQGLEIIDSKEIDMICTAILNHSDKKSIDGEYDELLKDADVLQHCAYNPKSPVAEHEKERYYRLLKEFRINEHLKC